MKRIILLLLTLSFILSGCSRIADLSDTGRVRIQMDNPDGSAGRFLAEEGERVYIAFLAGTDVYLYGEFDLVGDNTTFDMIGIVAGDYVLLTVLTTVDDEGESDKVVGLAVKEVTVNPGINDIPVTLGPGLSNMRINGESLDLTDLPEGYGITLSEDSLTFDLPDEDYNATEPKLIVEFRTNAESDTFDLEKMDPEGPGYLDWDKTEGLDEIQVTAEAYDGARDFKMIMTDPQHHETFEFFIRFE